MTASVAVLEVGGTHVSGARVDTGDWSVGPGPVRRRLDSDADAETILATVAAAGAIEAAAGARWAVAMPDPFDYERGIGRFHGVGKFESLNGVDVRRELMTRLANRPGHIAFCNDADAFALGEWVCGAAAGTERCVGVTLGTGVGSGWIAGGAIATDDVAGVPPGGRAHRLSVRGESLEDVMSARSIRRRYTARTGDAATDVRGIAERARAGDTAAREVLAFALRGLGEALDPGLAAFGAQVIVVGGSMAASWDLFEDWFREGAPSATVIRHSRDGEISALRGAAYATGLQ
ncbi:MAG: ROK family protein [Jatrophihabitantaceae bacterium]